MGHAVVSHRHICSAQECMWLNTGYYVKLVLWVDESNPILISPLCFVFWSHAMKDYWTNCDLYNGVTVSKWCKNNSQSLYCCCLWMMVHCMLPKFHVWGIEKLFTIDCLKDTWSCWFMDIMDVGWCDRAKGAVWINKDSKLGRTLSFSATRFLKTKTNSRYLSAEEKVTWKIELGRLSALRGTSFSTFT